MRNLYWKWKVGDREAVIEPCKARALAGLTWIPVKAMAEKLGRTRNASPLEYGHKCR